MCAHLLLAKNKIQKEAEKYQNIKNTRVYKNK